jgi:hypothetical protein
VTLTRPRRLPPRQIAPGTPDVITGGVFVVYGAVVDLVRNRGPVVTYGVNDMVLDNWGVVDHWIR